MSKKKIELQEDEEKWCDMFAGAVLMPEEDFLREVETFSHEEPLEKQMRQIEKLAKKFQVSSYAFLVRMKHLDVITQPQYNELENQLRKNYLAYKNKLQGGRISRNIVKEALEQYGTIYSKTVVQMYRNQEIDLHKFCKLVGIKKVSDALELETLL